VYVVDASVWVAYFVANDGFAEPSRAWLFDALDRGEALHAPTLALPEVAGAVRRRTGAARLAERAVGDVRFLTRDALHDLDAALGDAAATLAAGNGLPGADAVYVALAAVLDVPLVTWDERQLAVAGARGRTPLDAT
jgi:predicted nucleic acid-binding protein